MQTQRNIEPGTRVRTTAGMYATVTEVDDQDVVLEIAPGVEVRMMRRAIMDVVPEETETGYAEPAEDYEGAEAEEPAADDVPDNTPETVSKTEGDAAAN
jgi:preprotein translocase subunit YajC